MKCELLSLTVVAAASVFLFGCMADQPPPQNDTVHPVVGLWQPMGKSYLIEFFPDGSVQFRDDKSSAGNYSFPDDSHIRFDIDGKPMIARYEFIGDQLALTESGKGDLLLSRTSREELAELEVMHEAKKTIEKGLIAAAAPKAGITEYYLDYDRFPSSLEEAGIPSGQHYLPPGLKSVTYISKGTILLEYDFVGVARPENLSSLKIFITPSIEAGGDVSWNCSAEPVLANYDQVLPAYCWP